MVNAALVAIRNGFIQAIRADCAAQSHLWQLVPWLALQADGRDGGMGFYAEAYENGLWELRIPNWNAMRLYIDCMTGAITTFQWQPSVPARMVLAADSLVLYLANHLEVLDAAAVIEDLRREAARVPVSWISAEQAEERETARQLIATKLKLSKQYSRMPVLKAA